MIYCLQCQGDFAQFHKLIRDGADVNCRGGEPLREAITNSHVIIWTQVVTIITIVTIIMMMISCWTVPGWTWSSGTRMGGQPCTWLAGTTRLVVRGMEDAPREGLMGVGDRVASVIMLTLQRCPVPMLTQLV